MKYTCEIEIDLPREKMVALFDNPDNMKFWMPGFVSMTPLTGTPGREGVQSLLKFKMGKRDIEMIESITKRNLPEEFNGTYETKGVFNIQNNRFVSLGPSKTKWISESECRFSGYMKIFGFLMPGAFKKQSYKYLVHFKEFAEQGKKVNE